MKDFVASLFLALCLFSVDTRSETSGGQMRSFTLDSATVSLQVPGGFEPVKHLYSLPLVLLGPDRSQKGLANSPDTPDFQAQRASLAVIPTGARQVELSPQALAAEAEKHAHTRAQSIRKMGGIPLAPIPYTYLPLRSSAGPKGAAEAHAPAGIHRIGYRFRVGSRAFAEVSNYVVCGGQIFLLKALIPERGSALDQAQLEKSIESFRCE